LGSGREAKGAQRQAANTKAKRAELLWCERRKLDTLRRQDSFGVVSLASGGLFGTRKKYIYKHNNNNKKKK
jgi:hypothetical protein